MAWLKPDSRTHKGEGQTEEGIKKTDGKWFYAKLLDKYKLRNPERSFECNNFKR